ncbi:MAG: YodL domain-containing protein [Eubacteriales bacterium]|nr:YodL domain-containing protein [Eubacteriales bacterium]
MANRYTLTNEQRQQQVQDLTQQLEEGVKSVFESEKYAQYLKVMSHFTHYSVNNTILIAMQTGGQASMVAGYTAWQKNFGRQVNRGEKAIKIFAPMTYKRKKEVDMIDQATDQPLRNPDGSVRKEIIEVTVPSFRVTNVFDISQTSGPPLPTLVDELEGNVERYQDFVQAIRNISPVPVGFEEMEGKDGYYHQVEKRIAINENMSETQTMAAMIHELAHAKLHALDPNNLKESAKARGKDQRTMEVETESIAAVVSSYFGIDTSANSWGYVASWSRNKELPELTASLQVIKDTAGEIITGISEEMEEMRFTYMDKADALEAIALGQTVYTSVSKGRFEEVTADQVMEMPDDSWLRMPKDQMRVYVELRTEMDLHEEMVTLEETQLLYMPENQFCIYQIDPEGNGREYIFLSHDFMESEEMELNREDYRLEYVAPLTEADTLDTIYEHFNIDRPEDFKGHSLSVSDIVVMNREGEVKAYFVDSFGFADVTEEFMSRFYKRPEEISEAAFQIEDRYLEIHETDGGYDYSIYSEHYQLIDGGRYESDVDLMKAAKDIVQDLREPVFNAETGTYTRLPVQGNIDGNSRMMRIFFSHLHEMTLEFNRVDPKSMGGVVQEASPQQQYRSLVKVEEMEEQNYNMVDNVLNNGYGEKERREIIRVEEARYQEQTGASMTFYVAVCEEFHSMQACYEGLTFEDAVEKYKEIRQDPRLAYYGNAMGVEIHDESLEHYNGYAFPLVEGSVIEGDNLDFVKALAVHPLAREALELIREAFPEYRFVAPTEIKESFYPEHMTTEKLDGALMDLAKEFDAYEFMDQVENPEDALMEIKYNLLAGNGMQEYAAFLKDVKEESRELAPKAEALLGKLKEYSPELTEEIQPMVKIQFSQDSEFKEGSMIPLAEADKRFRAADERQADFNASHQGEARVLIVSYEIIYAEEDHMKSVGGTAFIGDGRGGILGNLQQEVEEYLHNQAWLDYKKGQGADNFQSYMAELRDTQEHALPYLQQFVSLEERGSAAIAEESTKTAPSGKESKAVTQTKTAKGKLMDEAPKKSIHARLQEKKKEIAKKPGKDSLQRGVELA